MNGMERIPGKIYSHDAMDRLNDIYGLAMDGAKDLSALEPPATEEEIETFEDMKAEIRAQKAKAKKKGKKIVFDVFE